MIHDSKERERLCEFEFDFYLAVSHYTHINAVYVFLRLHFSSSELIHVFGF